MLWNMMLHTPCCALAPPAPASSAAAAKINAVVEALGMVTIAEMANEQVTATPVAVVRR